MNVSVPVESPRDLCRVAGISGTEVSHLFRCSLSLATKKLRGDRPMYRREADLLFAVVRDRGVVISEQRFLDLINDSGKVVARPRWTTRPADVTGRVDDDQKTT